MSTSIIKKLDLFSLPFQFQMLDNDRQKKTTFGGCISVFVIGFSFSYFIYLCYLYFGNFMQPTIFALNQYLDKDFEIDIKNSILGFKITLPGGRYLQDLEKETGKAYLSTVILYTTTDTNGVEQNVPLSIIYCDDENLLDYYCIDFSNVSGQQDSIPLKYTTGKVELYKFQILLMYCTPALISEGQVCASDLEIRQQVLRITTNVEIKIITKQFNSSTKNYENKIKQEQFYFSEGLVQVTKIALQKTVTKLSEGFIIQSTSTNSYISQYLRTDTTNTYQYLKDELGLDMIVGVSIFLSESGKEENIQYAQFTTLLAQFSSVFNSLLAIGFICKIFAQNEILQDFVELQLKVYYKKTAAELLLNIDNRKKSTQSNPQQTDQFNLFKKIQKMDYKYYISQYLNVNFFNRLKLFIFNAFDSKKNDKDPKELKLYKQLINSTSKSMNIFEIQKDLMKIKMMMMMILSVEQYAAIQLCGLKIDAQKNDLVDIDQQNAPNKQIQKEEQLMEQNSENCQLEIEIKKTRIYPLQFENKQVDTEKQSSNKDNIELYNQLSQSHLEKIDLLEKDSNYFEKCIEKFFNKNSYPSDLDKRILGSMIGADQVQIQNITNRLQQKLIVDNYK